MPKPTLKYVCTVCRAEFPYNTGQKAGAAHWRREHAGKTIDVDHGTYRVFGVATDEPVLEVHPA